MIRAPGVLAPATGEAPQLQRRRLILAGAALLGGCATTGAGPFPDPGIDKAKASTNGEPVAMLDDAGRRVNIVPAWIDGNGPHRFVLDTGAEYSVISHDLARRLGIEGHRNVRMLGTSGTIQGRVGSIRSLAVGSARIDGLQAAMIDERQTMSETGHPGIDGIVGASFLRHFRITMDFPKKTVVFVIGQSSAAAAADAGRRVVVPLHRLVPSQHLMTLDVKINDQGPHRLLLDSGADITLITKRVAAGLALEHVRSTQIHGIAGPKSIDIVAAKSIAVGNLRAAGQVRIGVIDERIAAADIDGLLGMDFLRQLRVTLDYQAPSLAFEQVRVAVPSAAQPVRVE